MSAKNDCEQRLAAFAAGDEWEGPQIALGGWLRGVLIDILGREEEDLPWEEDPYCKACGDNLKFVEDAVHYMCKDCAEGYGFRE